MGIGSPWGLSKPQLSLSRKFENNVQSTLWQDWLDFCGKLGENPPDTIILIGNILDETAIHPRRVGRTELSLVDLCDSAVSILSMIPKAKGCKIYGLLGSGKRSQEYVAANQLIYEKLGGRFCGPTAIFSFNRHGFRVYHGATTALVYVELAMGRRRAFAQEAIAQKKLPEIEGIICGRSHRWLHMKTMWRDGKDFHVVMVPGWQGQTDFMLFKDPDKMIPEIGAVLGYFWRDHVDFRCIRYPTPLGLSGLVKT